MSKRDNTPTYQRKTLNHILARGFDESYATADGVRVRCSQCEALCICGVAAHETGCPHATHECAGCDEIIPARQKYCQECAS